MRKIIFILFMVMLVFPQGINAETGSITLVSSKTASYSIGAGGGAHTANMTFIHFRSATYNSLSKVVITVDPSVGFSTQSNTTTFTCTGNASCSGTVFYTASDRNVTWIFDGDGAQTTGEFIKIQYDDGYNFWRQLSVGGVPGKVVQGDLGIPSDVAPAFVCTNDGTLCSPSSKIKGSYYVEFGTIVTNEYIATYPQSGLFQVAVTKNGASGVNTKWRIYDSNNITYSGGIESSFNTNPFNFVASQGSGIYVNMSLSSGTHSIFAINTTNVIIDSTTLPPVVDPITGVGIKFDFSEYFKGDVANISWVRLAATPFGYSDDIYIYNPDGTNELIVSSPRNTGYVRVLVSNAGTYEVKFIRSVLGFFPETLASGTATVGQEDPSYVYAPMNVAVGKLFNTTYKIGFTPSNAFIETQFYNSSGGWEHELFYSTNQQKGVEANVSILVKSSGKYLIILADAIGGKKASTQTTAFFNGTDPVLNISLSNITIDKSSLSYGEHMKINVFVDNFNWSNKQVYVDSYNWIYGIAQSQQQIQSQHEVFDQFISDTTFASPGASAMRLMGKNDTGTYVLAYANFTLSELDTEGYGLSLSNTDLCSGDTANIKVIVPAGTVANLSVSSDNAKENKDWSINGSKTVPYNFKSEGSYYITLRVNGEAKRLIIINTKTCIVITPIPTPISGAGQANDVAKMIQSSIFWSFIITAGLMIAIAGKTRDGMATGMVGMLSGGIFTFIGWMPPVIFFSVFIIAALLLAATVVSKQIGKAG